jgi:lipoprotein-releasing system permease protein
LNFGTLTYISSKLLRGNEKRYSKVVVNIAVAAVAVSIAVMIISVSVLKGFQHEIGNKIIGFSGQIRVSTFSANVSLQASPLAIEKKTYNIIKKVSPNAKIAAYAMKGGIIKANDNIEGAILKGVDSTYDFSFLQQHLLQGKIPNISSKANEILISKNLANKLNLKLHESVFMYFIEQPARVRKLKITGIYNTGLEEFDNRFVFGSLSTVQKLNNWKNHEVDALEITLEKNESVELVSEQLYEELPSSLNVETVKELYPQLFDWLKLQDLNVIIIVVMMLLVGTINMVTALLILILEKTKTIGLLKSIGTSNKDVMKIFMINAGRLIFKGAIIGNAVGLTIIGLQHTFNLIPLDAASYYMSFVPVSFDIISFATINIISIGISLLCMLIPALIIRRISPAKVIRF